MGRILIGLLILFSSEAFAISVPTVNALSLGGVVTADNLSISEPNSQGYFTIYGGGPSLTGPNYSPFYKNGVPYQVTAGKTFQVVKICGGSSVGSSGYQLVSGTAAIAFNSAGVPTGAVYQGGATQQYPMTFAGGLAASTVGCYDATYVFAASTYPGFQVQSAAQVTIAILGKEI